MDELVKWNKAKFIEKSKEYQMESRSSKCGKYLTTRKWLIVVKRVSRGVKWNKKPWILSYKGEKLCNDLDIRNIEHMAEKDAMERFTLNQLNSKYSL